MRDGRLSARGKLIQVGIWLGLICGIAFILNVSLIGVQSGLFPTSEGNGFQGPPTKFEMRVQETGRTTYTGVSGGVSAITQELKEELMNEVYPTPDAAFEAVSGELPGNAAHAHYGYVCWNQNYSIEWNKTGAGKHVTWHRKDYNGYRYTTTVHKILSGGYWVVTDTFKTRTRLSYC